MVISRFLTFAGWTWSLVCSLGSSPCPYESTNNSTNAPNPEFSLKHSSDQAIPFCLFYQLLGSSLECFHPSEISFPLFASILKFSIHIFCSNTLLTILVNFFPSCYQLKTPIATLKPVFLLLCFLKLFHNILSIEIVFYFRCTALQRLLLDA